MSLQVLRAVANVPASATSTLITAVSGRVIRVVQVGLNCGTATNVVFLGSGTAITPTWYIGSTGGFALNYSEKGWFQTVSGEALTMTTSTGGTVGVLIGYTHETP